jgi:MFS family permease
MTAESKANPAYRWVILGINFVICALAYAGLTTWGMASADLAKTFNISATTASLGSSLFMLGYAVGSVAENNIAAKRGYRMGGLVGLVLMVVGIFGIPVAPNYETVLVLRFCQGWGILWLIGVNSTVAWFPASQRGLASSLIGASLVLGVGSGSLLATALITMAGAWQGAFQYFGCILLFFTVVWALLMRNPPADLYPEDKIAQAAATGSERINPYRTVAAWLCALCLFFNVWQLIGFNTIASNYMVSLDYTAVQAGSVVLLCGLAGLVSTPVGGILSDWLVKKGMEPVRARSRTQALFGFGIAAAMSFIFPILAPLSFGMALFGSVLVGWGVPVTNATLGALPMDMLGNREAANSMFALTILGGIGAGGFLVPPIAGYAAEYFGYSTAMIVLGLGAVGGMLISLSLPRFQLKHS